MGEDSMNDSSVGGREILNFHMGTEAYGVDILKVQEIRSFEPPTRMANAPAHILGVINLRGLIVPVLDLRLIFGQHLPTYDSQTVTIVLSLAKRVVGMVVDLVHDVIALTPEQIKTTPEFSQGSVASEHILGIANLKQEQHMLMLLDIEKLMASPSTGLVAEHIGSSLA